MSFLDYLKALTDPQRAALARACQTTQAHLFQVARGHRRAGEHLCINIERETAGRFKCEEFRPDVDWAYIRSTGPLKAA